MQSVQADEDDDFSSSYCCIRVCKNYKDPNAGVDLYPLPKTDFERDLWCKVFGISPIIARHPSSRVCGAHFRYKYFLRDDNKSSSEKPIPFTVFVDDNGQKVIAASNANSNIHIQNQMLSVLRQPVLQSSQVKELPGTFLRNAVYTSNVQDNIACDVTLASATAGSLLNNGHLMLECQEETLSPAQLSQHNSDWNAFKEAIHKELNVHSVSSSSYLQTSGAPNNVSTVTKVHLNSGGQIVSQTIDRQIGPITLASSSSPQLVHIPKAPQSVLRPGTNLTPRIVQVQSQNSAIGAVSSVSKLPFRIVQVQSPNSSAPNFQLVNTSSATFQPQFVQVPFSLQGSSNQITSFSNSPFSQKSTILNQSNNLPTPPFFYINSQDITTSVPMAVSSSSTNCMTVSSTISSPSSTFGSSSLPSVLKSPSDYSVSDVPKKNVIPVLLRRVDESNEKNSDTKKPLGEAILPLLPSKVGNTDSFALKTIIMQSVQADEDDDFSSSYCCIRVCKNYKDPNAGVDLYPLPKTDFERDLWCKVFGISPIIARHPSSRVCGAHFRYKYFLRDDNKSSSEKPIPFTVFVDDNGQKVIAASNANSNIHIQNSSSPVSTLDASSPSVTIPLEDNAEEPDLSNVTAVYGEESISTVAGHDLNGKSGGKNLLSSLCSGATILRKYFENRKTGTSILSNQSAPSGPVIVDVVSAKEGGLAHYSYDKINKSLSEKTTEKIIRKSEPQLIDHSLQNTRVIIKNDSGSILKPNSTPSDMPLISKIMHPHSIFSLQKSIPVIPGGTLNYCGTRSLFSIKTITTKNRVEDAHALRERLRTENFIVTSVWWLIQKRYMPLTPPCSLCGCMYFTINRNRKFYDGYCWTCQNKSCGSQEPIKRPNFFTRFQFYTLEDLLLLTYHWACQSDLEDILQDVNLDIEKIFSYYSALQELCRDIVEQKGKLGSFPRSQIETSVVKLGNNFILGAYERSNRATRLEAISVHEAFGSPQHLVILEKWLNKDSIIISESKISDDYLTDIFKTSSDTSITDVKSKGPHTINISRYLVRNMISLFGKLQIQMMSQKVIQGFLYELQWRERYGKYNDTAFWSIFDHISNLNDPHDNGVQVIAGEFEIEKFVYLNEGVMHRWGRICPKEVIENSINSKVQLLATESVYSRELESFGKYRFETKSTSLNDLMKSRFWLHGSLNMLFQDLPEVPGGDCNVNSRSFLNIKIQFAETPEEIEAVEADSESLGLRLSAEGYKDSPVRWLVKKGYIKSSAPCYVCNKMSYLRNNPKFADGCSWCCQNRGCKFENIFKRPQFYARFPMLSMTHMSAMIFHWSVQSEASLIAVDVPMDLIKLYHVWRSFQVLCSTSLRKKKVRLGGEKEIVEIALVQYGKLYILGAMERKTRHTLLRTFPVELKQQVPVFFRMISQWILPKSIVVINATKYFQMPDDYVIEIADPSIIDIADSSYHVLNITSYLLKQISAMFGHLKADDVRVEVLQTFLDELMWRERFGKLPTDAFYNIMKNIFSLEEKDGGNALASPPPISNGEAQSDVNQENVNEEDFMYDKLAIPDETKNSEEKVLAEVEQTIDPASLPKLSVVLERIPDTVLRYYNCLPTEPTETCPPSVQKTVKPLIISKSQISKKNFSSTNREIYFAPHVSPKVSTSTQRTYSKSKPIATKQVIIKSHKKRKTTLPDDEEDVEVEILDQESLDSSDDSDTESHSESVEVTPSVSTRSKNFLSKNREIYFAPHVAPKVGASNPRTYSRSKSNATKQSSCKLRKRPKVTLTENEKDKIELFDQESLDNVLSSNESYLESPSESVEVVRSVTTRNKKEKRKQFTGANETDGLICVECGTAVTVDHFRLLPYPMELDGPILIILCRWREQKNFSKEFSCMDCKPKLYTTCCCNSFMYHRGVLLFGKRMPRKSTETYGLHKLITLQDSYYCSCGFHSNMGNKLARHMVKCRKSTCYYQADIS